MKKILLINAHQPYPFSEGRLNQTLTEHATRHLRERGYEVRLTTMLDEWDVESEIARVLDRVGLERAEGEVLEFPFELPDAQAIGQRGVDFARLDGNGALFFR